MICDDNPMIFLLAFLCLHSYPAASLAFGPNGAAVAGSPRRTSRAVGTALLLNAPDATASADARPAAAARGGRRRSPPAPKPRGMWKPPSENSDQRRGRVFVAESPMDLLDFVVEDDRLCVVKVHASWCTTCKKFDARYRKIASQFGDSYDGSGTRVVKRGRVRFAEMPYENPDNEELCRDVLGIENFPHILIYRGGVGKLEGFHITPAKSQMLVDALNKHLGGGGDVEEIGMGQHQQQTYPPRDDDRFQYGVHHGKIWDHDAKKDVYDRWDPVRPRSVRNFDPFETFRGNSCDASGFYPGEPRYQEPVRGDVSYATVQAERADAAERNSNPSPVPERGAPAARIEMRCISIGVIF
ncbi:hypothetical protein ACHAWF_016518 [Thalassiosira exigua]